MLMFVLLIFNIMNKLPIQNIDQDDLNTSADQTPTEQESTSYINELLQLQSKAREWFKNWRQEFDNAELFMAMYG